MGGYLKVQISHPENFASVLVVVAKSRSNPDALIGYKKAGKKIGKVKAIQELDVSRKKNQLKRKFLNKLVLLPNNIASHIFTTVKL